MSACDHQFFKLRKHDRSGDRGRWVVVGYRCGLCGQETPPPKWVDLIGIDPDYTDGRPVDEWLSEQRGEGRS